MASVIEINDLRELEGYRLAWTALLAETPRASFFHTFEWVETYWRHFGEGGTLRVLVVEAGGKPIGIVPLCVKRERRQFGQVRVLTYPLDGWGTWYSPVGGAQAATLTLAMRHIASTRRDWDLIDLPWVDADGSDRGRTERAITAAGMRCGTGVSEVTSVVELQGGWDDYLAGMPSKARCEVRRNERRLHAAGEVEHVRWRPAPAREGGGEPAWELYNACEDVARRSWQAGLTDGNTLSHRRCRPFLREAHAAAAKLGMVDMNLLRINGETVAFNYNYHFDGSVFGLRMGYRTGAAPSGAGASLVMLTLKDSFARGDRRFELGVGDQPYKQRIRTGVERSYRVTHAPLASWRSQALRLGRWVRSHRGRHESEANAKAGVGSK